MEAVLLVLALAAMAAVAYGVREAELRQAEANRIRARDVSEALGLQARPDASLAGNYRGLPLTLTSRSETNRGLRTAVTMTLPATLPNALRVTRQDELGNMAERLLGGGITLGVDLDPHLAVSGQSPESATDILTDPAVEQALAMVLEQPHANFSLFERTLTVTIPGHHLVDPRPLLDLAAELGQALVQATRGPWEALADRYGLDWDETPDGDALTGEVLGVPLSIRYGAPGRTTIVANLHDPLPVSTHIVHTDYGAGEPIGDPIIDQMLAITTSDSAALASRISDDATRGPLLEICHGFPGSCVSASTIHLTHYGRLLRRLPAAVESVAELATALRRRWREPATQPR